MIYIPKENEIIGTDCYSSWLDTEDYESLENLFLIESVLDDMKYEIFENLNSLCLSMLCDIVDYSIPEHMKKDYPGLDSLKKGGLITYNKRTIVEACILEEKGNAPVSFLYYN